jgi:hypothetical protein
MNDDPGAKERQQDQNDVGEQGPPPDPKPLEQPQAEASAPEEPSKGESKALSAVERPNRLDRIFHGTLAAMSVLTGVGVYCQLDYTRQSLELSRQSVNVARESLEKSLRAWLGISNVIFVEGGWKTATRIRIVLLNSGPIPAVDPTITMALYSGSENPIEAPAKGIRVDRTINPGRNATVDWNFHGFSEASKARISAGQPITLKLRISYGDPFKERHEPELACYSLNAGTSVFESCKLAEQGE